MTEDNIYRFNDSIVSSDVPQDKAYKSVHKHKDTPIIIDNGSWESRVGWGSDEEPSLVFRTVMARMRGKRGESDYTLIGNDIANIEALRSSIKNQFDRNIVTNFSNQEQMFDHMFTMLGLSNESSVHHPVAVTEPPCNPRYCQSAMSELLFECYDVPSLSYGVDALYNLYHTLSGRVSDALIISSGYQTTHVLPVVNGYYQPGHSKRINLGGLQVSYCLQRLLQLRHQALHSLITLTRAEELTHRHCFIANNYTDTLRGKEWKNLTVQLPYNYGGVAMSGASPVDVVKQEEKVAQRRERARQHLLRLSQTKKEEKIATLEGQLEKLIHLQQLAAVVTDPEEYQTVLEEGGYNSLEAVLKEITQIQDGLEVERTRLLATQQKMQEVSTNAGNVGGANEPVDPQWIESLHNRKKTLLDQKKSRQQSKHDYSKRRSAASQDRMRIISQLAEDTPTTGKSGRQQEDTFGMNEDDWNIYRTIRKPGSGSDSEKEDVELMEINKLLLQYDPPKQQQPVLGGGAHQLQLGVELCRAPESLFQPSMIGIDQCGLSDVLESVLSHYPLDVQDRLTNCVLVCGGNTQFNGLEERLFNELTAIRPFQSTFTIQSAIDKSHGGWKGAALWSRLSSERAWFTQSEYKEQGVDYWMEHSSNIFTAT